MKGLTVFPEHAELFRLGIRTIETRDRRTSHRGLLAIRASLRDPDCAAARRDRISCAAMGAIPHGDPLPHGAITSVVEVVDCLPIVGPDDAVTPAGSPCLMVDGDQLTEWGSPDYWCGEQDERDLSDQLPYGDFRVGRYGWLFANVHPLAEPVPSPCLPGMFDLRPDVEAAVRAQLREVVAS